VGDDDVRTVTPQTPVPEPVDPVAEARLAVFLRAELALAEVTEVEAPDYEELEAYVDGRLSEADAEALAARIEDDAVVAAEVADLERLRLQLAQRRGAARGPRPALPRWIWAAAAALAVAVAGTVAERITAPHRPVASPLIAEGAAPEPPQIFTDSFESGSTASWN
jgi:anti-sigma factor RsiW